MWTGRGIYRRLWWSRALLRLFGRVDQLEPAVRVGTLGERCGVGGGKDFHGGIGVELPDVATYGCAVSTAQDRVHVDNRLAIERGDVADQRQDFYLFVGDGGVVHLFLKIKPGGGGGAYGSDAGEVGVGDVIFSREIGEAAQDFVA